MYVSNKRVKEFIEFFFIENEEYRLVHVYVCNNILFALPTNTYI